MGQTFEQTAEQRGPKWFQIGTNNLFMTYYI